MIVFAIAKGKYTVYKDGNQLVGYLTPEVEGLYRSDTHYKVTRLVEDGTEAPHGIMLMSEAQRLFEEIYS
jgi:hypothetical protein